MILSVFVCVVLFTSCSEEDDILPQPEDIENSVLEIDDDEEPDSIPASN